MRYAHRGWTVDLTWRELRADGKVTPIGGRAFELLEILVRANGEVVTKSELLDRVWPGSIVSENALEVHVSALRPALPSTPGSRKDLLPPTCARHRLCPNAIEDTPVIRPRHAARLVGRHRLCRS
jgi:hypothetical protein